MSFAQRLHDAQDLVVRLARRQARRQADVERLGLEEQFAAGLAPAGAVQGHAFAHRGGVARSDGCGQRVQVAADLAHVARHFRHALLVAVEFFERDHRQVDVVLLEAEQRRRVVHQHVRVEHKQLGGPGATWLARARLDARRAPRHGFQLRARCPLRSDGSGRRAVVVQVEHRRGRGVDARACFVRPCRGPGGGLRFEVGGAQHRAALGGGLGQWHGAGWVAKKQKAATVDCAAWFARLGRWRSYSSIDYAQRTIGHDSGRGHAAMARAKCAKPAVGPLLARPSAFSRFSSAP